jgi:hypothetical protein
MRSIGVALGVAVFGAVGLPTTTGVGLESDNPGMVILQPRAVGVQIVLLNPTSAIRGGKRLFCGLRTA